MRFARSASKHRVSKSSVRHVIAHCGLRFEQPAPPGAAARQNLRLVYLGDDAEGVALEIMAVESAGGDLFVIHAMPLRDKYRREYEEAIRWRV